MSGQQFWGYKGYIQKNGGEILYDAGSCCIAHYSYPEDTRYFVKCEFPVKTGLNETSSPEIWTSRESEAKYLLDNPDKVVDWLRRRIKADPKFSRYVDKPVIEMDHRLPNYGGNPRLLAKTPQYIIFRCHWAAREKYELAAECNPRGSHDSTPMWAVNLSKKEADALLAHPERIAPFFHAMQAKYPYGD